MKQKLFLLLTLVAVAFSSCKKEKTGDKRPDTDSAAVVEIPDGHTSQIAVDWEGEYKGIVPCEDCDGMETSLILNFDNTFSQSLTYIGKGGPYESKGTFEWDETGSIVILKFEDGSEARYKVGEGMISLLDEYGYPIEGGEYVLKK
jgi:uncharacterized lipoprotein NlpE involved in copper resistance